MSKRRDMELFAKWQKRLDELKCWKERRANAYGVLYEIDGKGGTFVEIRSDPAPELITSLAWEQYRYPLKDVRDIRLNDNAVVIKLVDETVRVPLG